MSVQNHRREQREAIRYTEKTASATLTADELENGFIAGNHASVQVDLTLTAASKGMKGYRSTIACEGAAATTIIVSAGFGGAGGGTDTITLAQGDMCVVECNGDYWFALSHTTPG